MSETTEIKCTSDIVADSINLAKLMLKVADELRKDYKEFNTPFALIRSAELYFEAYYFLKQYDK